MPGEVHAFVPRDIITHVVYVRQGDVAPCVPELNALGIECYGLDSEDPNNPYLTESRKYTQLRRMLD